jgi:hypothetical protein
MFRKMKGVKQGGAQQIQIMGKTVDLKALTAGEAASYM